MANIFPIIDTPEVTAATELPLYKTVAWDFVEHKPIFSGGNPVIVFGIEALKVWCWLAVLTQRTRYEIYSWGFGSELEALIGQGFTKELKEAEAIRYVKEALLVNPYILDVTDTVVGFSDGTLTITTKIHTVYGEARINV